jgi:diaminopimelate decarboxylase
MTSPPRHAALSRLEAHGPELLIGGVPLRRLAARVGSTPFYAYDRAALRTRVESLRAALPEKVLIHYAMKANPMPALVGYMATLVDGLDVASGGELLVALDTGITPADISFAGPGKHAHEIAQAVAAGIVINIESAREVDLAARAAEQVGCTARLAVRVNPAFELKSSGMQMGGGAKAFGIDEERVPGVIGQIRAAGLDFEGLHLFAGSQNLRVDAVCEAQRQAVEAGLRLSGEADVPLRSLNIGGGFGIPYFPGDQPLDVTAVGQRLGGVLAEHAPALADTAVIVELGRYLVGEAGYYVCRITERKESRNEVFLVTDGGLHHHLAASGNFGQIIRKNYPVVIGTRMDAPPGDPVDVVGPLCTPLDLLARRMPLPKAEAGDLVVVLQSGAYGLSASPTRFLGHPPPREVLV